MASESLSISSTAAHQFAGPSAQPQQQAAAQPVKRSADQSASLVSESRSTAESSKGQPAENLAATTSKEAKEAKAAADIDPKDKKGMNELMDEVNNTLYSMSRNLRFEVHEETEDLVVKVVNTKTDEVVRQYPPEEVLKHRERLLEGNTEAFAVQVD